MMARSARRFSNSASVTIRLSSAPFRRWQRGPIEGGVARDIGTGDNADVQRTPWAKGAVGQAVNHFERLYSQTII